MPGTSNEEDRKSSVSRAQKNVNNALKESNSDSKHEIRTKKKVTEDT